MMRFVSRALCAIVVLLSAGIARAQLQDGDHVAIVGDSITEQKFYSTMIEAYLLACQPAADLKTTQFGWGGEKASGFVNRIEDCLIFKPTVVTTCYGMNDGGYSALDDQRRNDYRRYQREMVQKFKAAGVRFIVVGSPGVVDSETWSRDDPDRDKVYNAALAELRDIAREVAEEEGVAFADVHSVMMDVMVKSKAKYGPAYPLGGRDGVHPPPAGHLVMAYAFLKALGVNGDIGTITVDLAAGKAEATDGHQVVAVDGNQVRLVSTRYPFCFSGNPEDPSATSGVIEFFPFNEDLNRFRLVVTGAGDGDVRVTWGQTTKQFKAADLAKGINLAEEFIDNPFSRPFLEVMQAARRQQNAETELIKQIMFSTRRAKQRLPERAAVLDEIRAELVKAHEPVRAETAATVKPVEHTIIIEPVK